MRMAEYIERERVLANAVFVHGQWDDTYVSAEKIKEIPAADVAPVRHGVWEFPILQDEDENDPRCKCSECGSIETPLVRHRYCPNCGARMDGGADHETD